MNRFDAALFLTFIVIPMLIGVAWPSPRRAKNALAAPFYGIAVLWVIFAFGFLGSRNLMTSIEGLNEVTGGVGGWLLMLLISVAPPLVSILIANWIRADRPKAE